MKQNLAKIESKAMNAKDDKYIPAMSHHSLTRFYDPVTSLMGMNKLRRLVIKALESSKDHRILDVGCGTGTLLQMLKKAEPHAELIGIDGDSEILNIAKEKADRENLNIRFEYGMAYELPYANDSFDRVVSTLVFHHLATADKKQAFIEINRVLRPDGKMIIADLGQPQGFFAKLIFPLMRKHARVADNLNGLLHIFAKEVGFSRIEDLSIFNSVMGTIRIFRASKRKIR